MENFRRSHFSTSVPELWTRRWHLSLAGWFRDYMYIPMGGSRVSPLRRHVNVMAVFLVSGLWARCELDVRGMGGGLNGLYQVISVMTRGLRERATAAVRMPPAVRTLLQCVVTFHLILVTWVFFRATSLADAVTVLSRIAESLVGLPTLLWVRLATGDVLLSVALIAVLVGVEALDERRPFWERLAVRPRYVRWGVYYALLIGLIVFGTWELQQFVYMQFYEVDRL